jgi:putative SOS response-associated peptidase YedK
MCGRYALAIEHELLRIRYGFAPGSVSTAPRYNVAPGQDNPIIIGGAGRELKPMRWGLVPHWAKDTSIGNKLINARADTAHEKPSFRDAFKKRRCLVPATGFFEWVQSKGQRGKRPMYIFLPDEKVFSLAGLWSAWRSPTDEEIRSYTILTTDPNDFMKKYHHRMPVILERGTEDVWLDEALSDPQKLQELLRPFAAQKMDAYEVSTIVNSPRNDTPECINKVA